MKTDTATRQQKRQPFMAMIDEDILRDVRHIAAESRFSVAHFLRESIIRNLKSYKKERD